MIAVGRDGRDHFSPPGAPDPWLPQPPSCAELTVAAQEADDTSTLRLYRDAVEARRKLFGDGLGLSRVDSGDDGVLIARRGTGAVCVLNTGTRPYRIPAHLGEPILGSTALSDRDLPPTPPPDSAPTDGLSPPSRRRPWVDGGAWLTIDDVQVDWIYRDLDRVRRIWRRCRAGRFEVGTRPGHPLGSTRTPRSGISGFVR